jgi:hypothetical protein
MPAVADQSGITTDTDNAAPQPQTAQPTQAPPQADASQALSGQAPSAPPATPAPPRTIQDVHRSLVAIVGNVLAGGSTKSVVNPQTAAIEQVPKTRGEKIRAGIANVLGIVGSAAGGASGHPVNLIAQQQQQQQAGLVDQQTAVWHNHQQLLAQRNEQRLDADQRARITESNRAFDAKAAEQNWTTPPIIVNGEDINGSSGHEADLMTYYHDATNHKAPTGFTYLYSPVPQADGTTAHKIYQIPVGNDLDSQVTYTRQEWKDIAGFDYPGKGDEIRTSARDMIGFRAANAKKQVAPSAASIKTNSDLIDSFTHIPAPQKKALKQLISQAETPEHLDGVVTKSLNLETQLAAAANKPERPERPADMVIGTLNGKQVAGTIDDLRTAGAQGMTKAGAAESEKINNARSLTNVFDSDDPDDLGLTQLAAKLDKQGKLGPAATRFGEWLNKGNTAANFDAGDPDVQRLFTKLGLSTTGLAQVHVGAKGSAYIIEHFQEMADAKKMSPSAFRTALDTENRYVKMKAMLPGSKGGKSAPSAANPQIQPFNPNALPKAQ